MRRVNRKMVAGVFCAVLLLIGLGAAASIPATDAALPRVPCNLQSYPAPPALDAPPNASFWTGAMLDNRWKPAPCTGWQSASTTLVIALAGHFANSSDVNVMLAHIGAISALQGMRYWSVTDRRWNVLFTQAVSLDGPNPKARRGDFSAAELRSGRELYFLSADNRLQKDLVTRIQAKEVEAERIVLEVTNVSPLRWLGFTVVPAGGMQTLYFLNRQTDGSWQFYSLTRVLNASLLSQLVTGPSYVNRAVAMYRYIAGIPTDRDPPIEP